MASWCICSGIWLHKVSSCIHTWHFVSSIAWPTWACLPASGRQIWCEVCAWSSRLLSHSTWSRQVHVHYSTADTWNIWRSKRLTSKLHAFLRRNVDREMDVFWSVVLSLHPQKCAVCCFAGRISHCNGPRPAFPCPYVRLSFVMAPEEDIPKGMQRLANVIKKVQTT